MLIVEFAEAAGFAVPVLVMLWTAALGVGLHAGYPPPSEGIEDAVLTACFAP